MKTLRLFLLTAAVVLVSLSLVQAQEKMTKDQWQADMTKYTQQVADLKAQIAKDSAGLSDAKAQSAKLDGDVRSCEDALYAMLGVSRADVEAFDKELAQMEARTDELQRMSDAELLNHRDELTHMDSRLGEMGNSKIALIPRYGARVGALKDKVAALMKSLSKEKSYTVGTWAHNRDCLWNIAKKKDIYDNAWLWPKIWQGNRDKIRDPDVIKPHWVLKIPEGKELSKEEKSSANSYYRKKASAPSGQ
jgi:nucleoid-associated protein YgaU